MKKNNRFVLGEYNQSVWLTYIGASLALIAMYTLMQGMTTLAMALFILSGICDLFDGVLARRLARSKEQERFGIEIDTLCDMISFVALPAILLLLQLPFGLGNLLFAIPYILAAVIRLAHFNRLAKSDEGTRQFFIGVPVTYSALVFPLSYLLCSYLLPASLPWIWSFLAVVLSFLFIWNHPIPKPNKTAYLFFLLLAVFSLIGLGVLAYG